ncbi:GNAT family N-acetyltransferase [Geomonas subterranea]|uniref:GNAT family N-acetyltransferase n=1 Tax=Geomonas subterranea TaxID=2847989 RepID=A0ABX8LBT1_9BACT|nr:GNAT family N-acetyltransferase [Geomonas subterranea]QXE89463.1 GNAT family N-acetyltransferase [Geomonas subterranea]QXM08421.1 GNAT family N-acetyltransferase [Geomonas subterranea]
MLLYCKMRLVQASEMVLTGGWRTLLRDVFYLNRVAVPVEIALDSLRPVTDFKRPPDESVLELSTELLAQRRLVYRFQSRYLKALNYLGQGYRGFALVKGETVAGDIWCADRRQETRATAHPDELWLGIQCAPGEAYTFDMFVDPAHRGGNLAAALQNGTLHLLRKRGITKAYGYFWADNLPALWVHRTLRWRELQRVRASRVLLSKKLNVNSQSAP